MINKESLMRTRITNSKIKKFKRFIKFLGKRLNFSRYSLIGEIKVGKNTYYKIPFEYYTDSGIYASENLIKRYKRIITDKTPIIKIANYFIFDIVEYIRREISCDYNTLYIIHKDALIITLEQESIDVKSRIKRMEKGMKQIDTTKYFNIGELNC